MDQDFPASHHIAGALRGVLRPNDQVCMAGSSSLSRFLFDGQVSGSLRGTTSSEENRVWPTSSGMWTCRDSDLALWAEDDGPGRYALGGQVGGFPLP